MMVAAARVMLLSLCRDRAALVLTFALPPVIFALLAAIFAGATGTELRLHVGLLDLSRSASGTRLEQALGQQDTFRVVPAQGDVTSLEEAVRDGVYTVGLVIRHDLDAKAKGEAPLLVIGTPTRPAASAIVAGQVLRTLNEKLPDIALSRIVGDVERAGKIDADERAFLEQAFAAEVEKGGEGFAFSRLVEQRDASGDKVSGGPVAYYAGAVAAIFLLFASMQGAATLLEERQAGIFARLRTGPHGLLPLLLGKFSFLTGQGIVQVALIAVAATVLYRVDVLVHPGLWLGTSLMASAMAAAVGLAVNAACATRQQAHLVSSFGVLIVSAVGGSMVPLYLMPPWLQDLSHLTPNAWVIDAFQVALRPDAGWADVVRPWAVLAGFALLAMGLAHVAIHRRPID